MQYIKGLEHYNNKKRAAITIGKFDGLHVGHTLLIEKIIEHQKKDNVDSVVLAFDVSCFSLKKNIITSKARRKLLEDKVDYLVESPLEDYILHMEPETFIKEILVDKFHIKYIAVGKDFRFGYQKKGDYQLLKSYEDTYEYEVEVVEDVCYDDKKVSSTYIRQLLENKEYELAETLLGHAFMKEEQDEKIY